MKYPLRLMVAAFAGLLICAGANAHSASAQEIANPDACAVPAPNYQPTNAHRRPTSPVRFAGGARLFSAIASPCPAPLRPSDV